MRLEISSRGRADIDRLFEYGLDNFGLSKARAYSTELLDLLDLALTQPKMGISKTEFGRNIRVIFFQSHVIYYRLGRDKVRIMRILHGRQKQTHLR
jgi:toxin ParE1/3/4